MSISFIIKTVTGRTDRTTEIRTFLNEKKNVLICAHGNSLRALVMHVEKISPEEIVKIEIATGEPIFYKFQNKEFFRT